MGIKDSYGRGLNGRTLIAILIVAILWRIFISLDGSIAFWESLCSGIAIILLSWAIFVQIYYKYIKTTGWSMTNWIYQGIAVSMVSINVYVVIYYVMRWYKLLHVEAYLPMDFLFQEKGLVHLLSPFLYQRGKKLREMGLSELIGAVITDERTLMVIVGLAFLWRTVISIDYNISIAESVCSGVALFIMGWLFWGYIVATSQKHKDWLDLAKVYYGVAIGVLAINIYVLVYYVMRWYRLSSLGGVTEAFVPLDYIFRDGRFFALVIFYCASIVLSKFLIRAYEEYRLLSTAEAKIHE
jgi:hypothetical protein